MKNSLFFARCLTAGVLCGALLVPLGAPALAQRRAAPVTQLELWPGQRVLLVLPLSIGENWNASPELGEAVLPLVASEVQRAFTETGKFSVTLPYRFDPILRRAVVENRVSDADVTALLQTPSLATAQPVMSRLNFEQPGMIADVTIEQLRIGGTERQPTAQLQVSARLHEVGGGLFRSVTVTSSPQTGRTPEARLNAAARDAFTEMARRLVERPVAFSLPTPDVAGPSPSLGNLTPGAPTTTMPGAPTTTMPGAPGVTTPGVATSGVTSPPPPVTMLPAASGPGFVPTLPEARAPLGIAVPEEPAVR